MMSGAMDWLARVFLTVKETCFILSESPRTFYRRIQEGKYPPLCKSGRKSLVSVDWVRAEIDRRKREAST